MDLRDRHRTGNPGRLISKQCGAAHTPSERFAITGSNFRISPAKLLELEHTMKAFKFAGKSPRLRWSRMAVWVASCTSVAAITGCTTPYEGHYDFYEGWRKGEIKQIETSATLKTSQPPWCGPAASSSTTYAIVRYRATRHSLNVAVPVSPNEGYKVGDLVYINVSDCPHPIRRRAAGN